MTEKKKVAPSKTQKKVQKALVQARKKASKTKLRDTKKVKVASKDAAKSTTAAVKEKFRGHAPQSSRISDPKGPIQAPASLTVFATKQDPNRRWLLVDAAGQTVGRLASQIASVLRGKHKATFTPNNDVGDFIIVINAEKVKFTSDKENTKKYHHHSGYIGGLKTSTPAKLRVNHPERILEKAIHGMVPRSPLGRAQMRKLHIYAGAEHPHVAQKPVVWNLRYNSNR